MVRPQHILVPAEGVFPPPAPWQAERAVPLLRNVLRLTAPNPSLMTGPGTNSYLVGTPATGFIAIDPGPADAAHVRRLWQCAQHADGTGGNLRAIVCTHSHADHAPGAPLLQALCGPEGARKAPIMGLASASTARPASHFVPQRQLEDGQTLRLGHHADDAGNSVSAHRAATANGGGAGGGGTDATHTLRVVHTPGHAANHLCLLLQEDGVLFSGDHILQGSTTVIDPPDGNMHAYLQSLDRLAALCAEFGVSHILPAHGHVIDQAGDTIARLKRHRLEREARVAMAMRMQPEGGLDDWLPLAYADVPPALWPVARRSLLAHVERLRLLSANGDVQLAM